MAMAATEPRETEGCLRLASDPWRERKQSVRSIDCHGPQTYAFVRLGHNGAANAKQDTQARLVAVACCKVHGAIPKGRGKLSSENSKEKSQDCAWSPTDPRRDTYRPPPLPSTYPPLVATLTWPPPEAKVRSASACPLAAARINGVRPCSSRSNTASVYCQMQCCA